MAVFDPVSALVGGALIGLASVLLMVLTGRIAGISGIFTGCFALVGGDKPWRLAFVTGLITAPLTSGLVGYPLPVPQMPMSWTIIGVCRVSSWSRGSRGRGVHFRARRLRHRPPFEPLDRRDGHFHGRRDGCRCHRASRLRRLTCFRLRASAVA